MQKHLLSITLNIFLLSSLIITVYCSPNQTQEKIKNNEPQPPTQQNQQNNYEYEKVEIKKTVPNCTDANQQNCTNFSLTYDKFKSGTHKDAINSKILDFILNNVYSTEDKKKFSTIDELINQFFTDYFEILVLKEKEKSDYPALPWMLEIQGEVKYISENFISYELNHFMFTGGAHPLSGTNYFNFNPATGKILNLGDVFKKGFDSELDKLIEKHFRSSYNIMPGQPLTEILFENHISHNNNFLLFPDGIEFCYNQYEIAPYAAGILKVRIPKSELVNLLNENFK
ncbi:MAG: DUF3298 and DUF4163 domain-containing protein [Ignavibacteria bacterium]